MKRILVIEDEQNIRRLLEYDLSKEGYTVSLVSDGQKALEAIERESFDVLVIDWMIPYINGLDLVKKLRKEGHKAIMIMLTAKDDELDLLEAFEAGVDDYITKPFSPRILQARIKAHLNRVSPLEHKTAILDLEIDHNEYEVYCQGQALNFTKTEFELFNYLISNQNKVLTRDQILNHLWGFDYDGDTRVVDVHIFKLRQKLDQSQLVIESIRGVGYIAKI